MITVDTHLHTLYSHGKATVEEMYNAAKEKKIRIIGFSEHSPRPDGYDYPTDYKSKLTAAFPQYVEKVQAYKANDDGITVLLGIEMDWIEARTDFIAESLAAYPFDYVIGGIHYVENWGFDFSKNDWDNLSEAEHYAHYVKYFKTMKAMAQTGMFNIAAHPDIIKIFSKETFHGWLNKPDSLNIIKEALSAIKNAGMAMEISSAGIRKVCQEIYPCRPVMEIARELELPVAFGSDAHSTASVGFAFETLEEYAREFGYTESVYFSERTMQKRPF